MSSKSKGNNYGARTRKAFGTSPGVKPPKKKRPLGYEDDEDTNITSN